MLTPTNGGWAAPIAFQHVKAGRLRPVALSGTRRTPVAPGIPTVAESGLPGFAVTSSFGVMFAPDQRRAARELVRVCRPGGRIALASWTPRGFVGQGVQLSPAHAPSAGPRPGAPGRPRPLATLGGVANFGDVSIESGGLTVRIVDAEGQVRATETIASE